MKSTNEAILIFLPELAFEGLTSEGSNTSPVIRVKCGSIMSYTAKGALVIDSGSDEYRVYPVKKPHKIVKHKRQDSKKETKSFDHYLKMYSAAGSH
ncbi:MAG: hypothetical protein N3B21_17020 [Clostridia bacterium]|nr:hypothetical protein [Clostridia bacterium]